MLKMYSLDKNKYLNFLLFIIVCLQLLMRPSIIQGYGSIILPISIFLMFVLLINKEKLIITWDNSLYIFFTSLFIIFLIVQNFFSNDGVSFIVLNSSLSILLPALLVLFIDRSNWHSALKAVIYPVILLSISYFITFLLFLFGIQLANLQYFNFDIEKTVGAYQVVVYFPFSITLGYDFPILGLRIARAIGYFREPGIFSPIVALSFFGLDYLRINHKLLLKVLLLFTLVLTFSTAGFMAFIMAFIYYYFISRTTKFSKNTTSNLYKFLILIISAPLIYIAVFGNYRFALMSKLSQNSGQERISSISESIDILLDNPLFGVGYPSTNVSGVTFLSTLGQIGIVGGILFLLIFIIPLINKIKYRDPILALIIPLFLVSFLSQPLFDKTLLFLLATIVISSPNNT